MPHTPSIANFVNHVLQIFKKSHSFLHKDKTMAKLSMQQMYYIDRIYHLKNPTVTELARELEITKPSVTAIVDKMGKEGIIHKNPVPNDKRSYTIELTEKGRDIAKKHDEVYDETFGRLKDILTPEEQQQFQNILKKIITHMGG